MATLKHRVRLLANRFNVELLPLPNADPLWPLVRILRNTEVTQVIDGGANNGGFARAILNLGYAGKVHSFEPLSSAFEQLRSATEGNERWHCYQLALGASEQNVTMNIAANNGASSSVLEMLETHKEAAPDALIVGAETVEQTTLDSFIRKTAEFSRHRYFVKLDVQGYEDQVLRGASESLADLNLVGLRLELSLVPLYQGSIDWKAAIANCEDLGFELVGLTPGFTAPSGRMLQTDGTFIRRQYLGSL